MVEKKLLKKRKYKMKNVELLEQFQEMKMKCIFEIKVDNGEYYIYHIDADESGIYGGGCNNYDGIFVEWDDTLSFDEHMESFYDLCLEDAQNNTFSLLKNRLESFYDLCLDYIKFKIKREQR